MADRYTPRPDRPDPIAQFAGLLVMLVTGILTTAFIASGIRILLTGG